MSEFDQVVCSDDVMCGCTEPQCVSKLSTQCMDDDALQYVRLCDMQRVPLLELHFDVLYTLLERGKLLKTGLHAAKET